VLQVDHKRTGFRPIRYSSGNNSIKPVISCVRDLGI